MKQEVSSELVSNYSSSLRGYDVRYGCIKLPELLITITRDRLANTRQTFPRRRQNDVKIAWQYPCMAI